MKFVYVLDVIATSFCSTLRIHDGSEIHEFTIYIDFHRFYSSVSRFHSRLVSAYVTDLLDGVIDVFLIK